jgi:hypothetical protein
MVSEWVVDFIFAVLVAWFTVFLFLFISMLM